MSEHEDVYREDYHGLLGDAKDLLLLLLGLTGPVSPFQGDRHRWLLPGGSTGSCAEPSGDRTGGPAAGTRPHVSQEGEIEYVGNPF
jgi:hypothetical protein